VTDKLNDAELHERITQVLKQVVPKRAWPDNISPETRLLEDLNMDSIHAVDLLFALEDAFDINIPDGVIETVKTAGDLVALVRERLPDTSRV
jgi:acyl carrier protein